MESTRGKAKFGKRHGSRKWEEENSATRRRHRGNGDETAENPLPIQCATHPRGSAGRVAFYYFVFLKRQKCIRGHFLVVFGMRSQGFSRIAGTSAGIRACVGRYVNQKNGWFSGPCLATLLPRIEIARA